MSKKVLNYSDFEVGLINRRLNNSNLKAKIKSIKEYGLLSPLTVVRRSNGKYLIIDGQHRFYALEKLEMPILKSYLNEIKIDESEIITIMAEINGLSLRWKKLDFVEVFAKSGNVNYQKILNFMNAYDDFGIVPYVTMLSLDTTSQKITKHYLESGEFEIGNIDKAYKLADDLMSLKPYSNYYKHFQFVMAFAKLWQLPNFNMDWMRSQFAKDKHIGRDGRDIFNGVANQSRFRELICQVYNHAIRGGDAAKIF